MKRTIRNLIIGTDVYIESRTEFRHVMLSGQYALLSLCAITFFLLLELSTGFTPTSLVYAVAAGLIVGSLVMHRFGKHGIANALLFPTLNLLLLIIVSTESSATFGFLFFFPLAISSAAVFNYSRRIHAIFFVLLSLAFLIFSMWNSLPVIPYRNYSAEVIQIAQFRNVLISFFLSVITVYLLISINHHISVRLEDSYRQTKKLNEELDRFVYSTSHDLRAPLLSVLGLLELVEKPATEDEKKNYHHLMRLKISSLDKFIKDIADYSRNERLQVVKVDIFLRALADDVWESLKYSQDAEGIEFINEIPPDLVVRNDGSRLRIVLSNVIANAIRYHEQRRDRKYIRLYHQKTTDSFAIHIEDNGQGIAPEIQTKIFDMFFRGNERSQGSGLGLYIVKETLAKLSSTIQLRSIIHQGSTFTISLPRSDPQE